MEYRNPVSRSVGRSDDLSSKVLSCREEGKKRVVKQRQLKHQQKVSVASHGGRNVTAGMRGRSNRGESRQDTAYLHISHYFSPMQVPDEPYEAGVLGGNK